MHLCVKCNKKIENFNDFEKGCECGSRVFIFVKDGENSEQEIKWIESELDTQGFEELNEQAQDEDKTIVMDVENVRMLENGVFHLNLESLLENPVVIKDTSGVYHIQLPKAKKE